MLPKYDDFIETTRTVNGALKLDDDKNNGFSTIKINRPNKNFHQPIITDDFSLFQETHDTTNNQNNITTENSTCDSNIEMTSSIDSLSNDGGHLNDIYCIESSNGVNFEQKSATDSNFSTCNDQLLITTADHEEETFESLNQCLTETTNTIANLSLSINLANDLFDTNSNNVNHLNLVKEADTNGEFLTTSPSFTILNSNNKDNKDASPNKQPTMFLKDMNIEERLRIIRDKQEQELAKRKKELEDNLKRKQELWFRQQKERQKKIDEYKIKENEKRLACEERRKKREDEERNRLNELIKRENERAKLSVKPSIKGSEWTLAVNGNQNEQVSSDEQTPANVMNKSHSAFNLNHRKKDLVNPEAVKSDTTATMSKRLTNSTMRLSPSTTNGSKNLAPETQEKSNDVIMKTHRSRTVPKTPMHCTNKSKNAQTPANNQPPPVETNDIHCNFRNNNSKMISASQTTSTTQAHNKNLYWEGPLAHFMLPTHAIHCRLSRSVERCPRACKAAAEAAAAEEAALMNSQKPLQTIVERNKPLSAHLQETINRLSMPKKPTLHTEAQEATMNSLSSNQHTVNGHRSATPLLTDLHVNNDSLSNNNHIATSSSNSLTLNKKPKQPTTAKKVTKPKIPNSKSSSSMLHRTSQNSVQNQPQDNVTNTTPVPKQPKNLNIKANNIKQADRKTAMGQSSSNGSIISLNTGLNQVKKSNSNLCLNQNSKQQKPSKSQESTSTSLSTSKVSTLTSNSTVSTNSDFKQTVVQNENEISQVISDMIDVQIAVKDVTTIELLKEDENVEDINESSSNDEVEVNSTDKESCPKLEEAVPSSSDSLLDSSLVKVAEIVPQRVLTEEEEYKIKLEEKRREAREKAAKEAELERQRQEIIRLEEEEKRRQEEEEERLAEEEVNRLHRLAREQEEARLQAAMELNERLENERREKEENEKRLKEENERKAKEEAEKVERERLEKIRKEEEERMERRKKIDLIMRRVHKDENTGSTTNSTNNLLISTSNNDLSQLKSMTSSFIQAKDSNENISTTLSASMTTSMINTPINTDSESTQNGRFKTPLLQSILSKTRITTILNKYADDPLVNNPTLSLIAQSNRIESIETSRSEKGDDHSHSEKSDDQEYSKKDEEEDDEDKQNDYELQMTEVNVVVEDSSADSSSPSSPVSSNSSRSSQQASPPAASSSQPPTTTPLQTQLSA